jgi:hypothetical protein
MGRLVFSTSVSLDGFVDTPSHSLDWVLVLVDEGPSSAPGSSTSIP